MIWLYILMPVFILGGIAVYFGKKSGMTPPDDGKLTEKIEEYPPEITILLDRSKFSYTIFIDLSTSLR